MRVVLLLTLAGTLGLGTACTQVVQQVLEVGPDSTVTVSANGTELVSEQVGGIESTVSLEVSLIDLLFKLPLNGTVTIDRILIAGTPLIVGTLSTGTLCTSPLDPADPGGGTIEISLRRRKLTLETSSVVGVQATDPIIGPGLGVLEIPVDILAVSPVSLLDLIGVLGGDPLPIAFAQTFELVIPDGPLAGAMVSGVLNLASADAFPTDPLISECEAFLAGP